MTEIETMTIALNDAATHARVIAHDLEQTILAIRQDYPNNRLGGLVERTEVIGSALLEHALALSVAADKAMASRPESIEVAEIEFGGPVPKSVIQLFESAELIRYPVSVDEAKQLADKGKLVVLRDLNAQSTKMVPQYGAIFESNVDPVTVRLWWARVFANEAHVTLLETEAYGVWIETTQASMEEGRE